MESDTGRPTKRARVQNLSFQLDLAAADRVPGYQPEWTRATTPFIEYQVHAPIAATWSKEHAFVQSDGTNVRNQTTSNDSDQLTRSAVGHNGLSDQCLENGLDNRRNVNGYQDFWPAQSSLEAEASYLLLPPLWPSSAPLDEDECVPQQYVPQFGSRPPQSTSSGEQATFSFSSFPGSAHSDSYGPPDVDLMAQYTQNLDVIPQLAVPQVAAEKVCFGMVQQLSGFCDVKSPTVAAEILVKFESPERFRSLDHEAIAGRLHSDHSQMIHGLLQEDTLELFVSCFTDKKKTASGKGRSLRVLSCTLEVTIYGPIELLEEIGDWFQEQDIYLQDPRSCHLDVKYCNPHKLSTGKIETCYLLSEVTANKRPWIEMQPISSGPNFLDSLNSRDDLYEAHQPMAICTPLKRHQKQALTFMIQRERGWAFDQECLDVWEAHKTDRGVYFVNRVSNAYQDEEPAEFRGGIIADTMGLGKTLTMIALVATDLDNPVERHDGVGVHHQDVPGVETTLIIIPPPLLDTWEEQLEEHVFHNRFNWCRHHGKNRIGSFDELYSQNIILTTYHTVSAEWKAHNNNQISPLFSVEWKRVILDEAHFIRNMNSTMARAVCNLSASSRWAVSGTPVQNRLSDLTSLLKFIRAHPYNDIKQFETDISSLWKSGKDEEAIKRLQYLSACLVLRRAKGTIDLPAKRDLLCPVDFLPDERELYETLKQQAIHSIDEAVSGQHGNSRPGVYANALQRIESLRLFSDLGLQYHARHETQSDDKWSRIAQQTFNSKRGIGPLFCLQCSLSLDFTESLLDEPDPGTPKPQFSSCMKFICSDCVRKLNQGNLTVECGHKPACPVASVSTGSDVFEETPDTLSSASSLSLRLSSKVEALITDLIRLPKDTKCVVFSTWRLTLDLVKVGLDQNSIASVRFDGKVSQNERGVVVNRFRTDPDARVMLLTLSCGAVGLTLTAASRAYLMEPHWNPTLEEQALARIHRLGQTKEVTTVRFFMRDSFEEEVIKVQDSKKQLASVLLSSHEGRSADDSIATLQALRSLL